jgi:hypothetical protein
VKTRVLALLAAGSVGVAPIQAGASPRAFEATPIGIVAQPFHVFTSVNARFVLRLPAAVTRTATMRFLLHRKVANRDSFRAIADHFAEPGVIDIVTVPVRRGVENGDNTAFDVLINTTVSARNDLFLSQDGVFPLTIQAVDGDGNVLATTLTFLNRRDLATVAVAVPTTVMATLTAPPSLNPDGEFALQDDARRAVERFVSFLGAAAGPVTVQIQPELVAALALSPELPDQQLLQSLQAALSGRRVVLMPYVPVDASALVRDGLADRVTDVVNLAQGTLSLRLPGAILQPTVWVANDALDQQTLSLLRNLGFTTVVLLPGAAQGVQREGNPVLLSRPDGKANASMAVVSVDDQMASTLDAATDDQVRTGYRIAAETIALRDDVIATGAGSDTARIVVSSSTGELVDGPTLDTALKALSTAPGIALRELAGSEAVSERTPAAVFPRSGDRSLGGLRNSVIQASRELEAITSMMPEDDPRAARWSELLAVAVAGGQNAGGFVDGLRSDLRRVTSSVSLTTSSDITLSSRSGSLRLQLRNDETVPLYVRVTVSSPKITSTGRADVVQLLPGSTTDVKVPVRARSNGSFPVSIKVTTPAGRVQVVSPTVITASVRAVAGLGQLVSITLLLVVVAWWWASWRRKRLESLAEDTVAGQ